MLAASVAEEGLSVRAYNLVVMLDSVASGRALTQCKGRVRTAGRFHIMHYQGAESVGVRRSAQQELAMQTALGDVAKSGVAGAIVEVQLGPNPLISPLVKL